MMKHRGLILALGLTALLGLSARESRAANMTLTVVYNGTTFTPFTGTMNAVTPSLTVLNGDLAGSGYSFTGIGGSSNNGFATSNAFVADSGTLQFTAGGTGGTLTIIVSETGFTAPASGTGNTMMSTQGATFTNTTAASSQSDVGNFMDSGAVNQNLPTSPSTLFGTTMASQSSSATAGLPAYAIPFTLTSTTTINMGAASSSSPGNDVFTSTTSVQSTVVPEPASLILTLTGMPLPLVVMGLLRRRRAAA